MLPLDPGVVILFFVCAFVFGGISGLLEARAEDSEPDPLDLARPSIERMEAEALEAAKELRQLEPPGRE